ncbi:hypothetical protein F4804DRAFT_182923 [Jackrogersella minutella]|nr:hypothetical protein F4804DRAFT_182923 [Jackrogersella minutella]
MALGFYNFNSLLGSAAEAASILLDDCLCRAYPRIQTPSGYKDGKADGKGPRLRRGRTNRILLFNGCLNPPHQGHPALLTHAYRHAGEDFNLAGAIVLVAADEFLPFKSGAGKKEVVRLHQDRRVQLWDEQLWRGVPADGDGARTEKVDWCWVLPENDWPGVANALGARFRDEGFVVEFVKLAGGDKFGVDSVQHGVWGCKTTVTTDISRPPGFYAPCRDEFIHVPRSLKGHTPWMLVWWRGMKDGEDYARVAWPWRSLDKIARPASNTRHKRSPPFSREGSRDVWTCRLLCDPPTAVPHDIRFINGTPDERVDPELSSTRVQLLLRGAVDPRNSRAIRDYWLAHLADELRGKALCPDLLAEFMVCTPGEAFMLLW